MYHRPSRTLLEHIVHSAIKNRKRRNQDQTRAAEIDAASVRGPKGGKYVLTSGGRKRYV